MGAAYDKYTVTQYSVSSILGYIEAGDIAIPEIQRPFVWKGRQVRDLIDSLYNGYPTGYLIIWQNPDVKLKDGRNAVGKKVLIDGQQRITALMTAIAGHKILTEDYEEKTIRIAFNPLAKDEEDRFAVTTPAHINSSFWIPDIAEVFKSDFDSYEFVDTYAEKNPGVSKKEVNQKITQLLNIKSCQIGAILLVPQLDISEVTEIFVRINSQGKRLNEADFAMSKIAADEKYGGNSLRKAIDYFCHLAVEPAFYAQLSNGDKEFMKTEYAGKMRWLKDDREDIYDPDYNDMLRVSFMHMFGRGKLGDLVSLLSGRDFVDRSFKEEIAEDSFTKLTKGVNNFMNQYTFEQFVLAIKSAGFITSKLLNSQMTLDFAYTLFLILQQSGEVPKIEIKHYIQRWFVLSTLTKLSLFSYSLASMLEVMLSGNFKEEYVQGICHELEEQGAAYRELFTKSSVFLEKISGTAIEKSVLKGIGTTSVALGKLMGELPLLKKGPADEFLKDRGVKLSTQAEKLESAAVRSFAEIRDPGIRVFVSRMTEMSQIYNHTSDICFDDKNIYLLG